MSLELLLLLAVFILLPLIEQLVRAARRDQGTTEGAEGQPAPPPRRVPQPARTPQPQARAPLPQPAPQLPAHAPLPPTVAVPPLPQTARHAASDASARRVRTPVRGAAQPVALATTPHRSTRRPTAVVDLGNLSDLRRAIVLMAMLEPCRALNPYDGPERAGRQ